jgi:uncharacterized ParB-like nuclease family protein
VKEIKMKKQNVFRSFSLLMVVLVVTASTGCSSIGNQTEPAATPSPVPESIDAATQVAEATPEPTHDHDVLYNDDFTNPATGWPEETFDNYFIGYHEPEYYHVAITSPNYKTTVFVPERPTFSDATIDVNAFTFASKTAETGDFRYGVIFRRSGDQYYAFTVSQRTKQWAVLKSSSTGLAILKEGTDDGIHDLDVVDALRVDMQGSTFFFHINDQFIAQVEDREYASGEVGFFVQTLDAANLHIHYDSITVRHIDAPEVAQAPQSQSATLYVDLFTNPTTGWPEKTFDNYFIGYHEPEYYHIAITGPNYKTTVFIPGRPIYDDITIEVKAFTFSSKTAETGDFRYGIAFRRSGDQYYAFTVSQRTKKWAVLKSTPNALVVLEEGTQAGINDLDVVDILRVDAKGSTFFFHINDQFIAEVDDPDYASGEVGFYVETLDIPSLHIHYDAITVRTFEPRLVCTITALAINLRTGPGKSYSSPSYLTKGDIVQPTGQSPDGEWINVTLEGGGEQGWIANEENFVSCNAPPDILPVINP